MQGLIVSLSIHCTCICNCVSSLLQGDLGQLYHRWSKDLIHVRKVFPTAWTKSEYDWCSLVLSCLLQSVAHVEAMIDFGEDENIEEGLLSEGRSVDRHAGTDPEMVLICAKARRVAAQQWHTISHSTSISSPRISPYMIFDLRCYCNFFP